MLDCDRLDIVWEMYCDSLMKCVKQKRLLLPVWEFEDKGNIRRHYIIRYYGENSV